MKRVIRTDSTYDYEPIVIEAEEQIEDLEKELEDIEINGEN